MANPMITIHNSETNEIINREMNDAEFAAYEVIQTELADNATVRAKAATDKAALLAKLGITADEAKLLLS